MQAAEHCFREQFAHQPGFNSLVGGLLGGGHPHHRGQLGQSQDDESSVL